MKKLVILIGLVIFAGGVSAQEKITYSFEAGFSVSFFDSPNAPHDTPELVEEFSKNTRGSLELGINADVYLSDLWTLSSGLEYVERGGSYRSKNPGIIYTNQFSGAKEDDAYNYLRYRLSYLELPLRLKFDIAKLIKPESADRINIFVGPTAMLNLDSKRRYNIFEGSSEVKETWEVDKLPGAQNFVVGINTGVEWRAGKLVMYAKYLRNLTALYDTSQAGYENFNTRMHSITLGMGFEF